MALKKLSSMIKKTSPGLLFAFLSFASAFFTLSSASAQSPAEPPAQAVAAPAEPAAPAIPLPPSIGGGGKAGGPASIEPPKEEKPLEDESEAQIDPLAWDESATPAAPTAPTPPAVAEPLPDTPMMGDAAPAPVSAETQPAATSPADPVSPAVAPPAPTAESAGAFEDRLKSLEKEIADLKAAMASKDDLEKLRRDIQSQTPVGQNAAPAASKDAPVVKKKPRKSSTQSKKAAPAWILKSAKPGMAWVAKPGSSELQTVAVGDNLPGVGKIKSISLDSMGKWVVNGSNGRINQK